IRKQQRMMYFIYLYCSNLPLMEILPMYSAQAALQADHFQEKWTNKLLGIRALGQSFCTPERLHSLAHWQDTLGKELDLRGYGLIPSNLSKPTHPSYFQESDYFFEEWKQYNQEGSEIRICLTLDFQQE